MNCKYIEVIQTLWKKRDVNKPLSSFLKSKTNDANLVSKPVYSTTNKNIEYSKHKQNTYFTR